MFTPAREVNWLSGQPLWGTYDSDRACVNERRQPARCLWSVGRARRSVECQRPGHRLPVRRRRRRWAGEDLVTIERGAKIGFLGLGAMGLPMAANLVEAGFDVTGFDVLPERVAELRAQGGRGATSAAESARGARVVAAIPFDGEQIRQTMLGEGGALETLAPGSLVILMATVGPRALRDLAAEIVARGYRVVDAPVTGGAAGAKAGTLTVIAAGADED